MEANKTVILNNYKLLIIFSNKVYVSSYMNVCNSSRTCKKWANLGNLFL